MYLCDDCLLYFVLVHLKFGIVFVWGVLLCVVVFDLVSVAIMHEKSDYETSGAT